MFATINKNKITLSDFSVSIDNEIEAYGSTSQLTFFEQIVDDNTVDLIFENKIEESVFIKVKSPDGTLKIVTATYSSLETIPSVIEPINLKNSIELIDGFEFIGTIEKEKLSIFVSEYSVDDLFKYPDFPTKKTKLSFSVESNSIPYSFSRDFLYEIKYSYEGSVYSFLYVYGTPNIYYCGTGEIKRFFASEKIFEDFYKDEELIFIIWKKSLEAQAISGLTYDLKPSSHAVSIFEKYIKYSIACDILFALLSNTNVDDEKMFQSLNKIQLSDLNVSGSTSTPYDSYSTSYMRFLREKESLVKEMKTLVGFKTKDTEYKLGDRIKRRWI